MARVIKGGGGAGGPKGPHRPATRMIVDAGDKKIIGRAAFQAKQDAEHILKKADEERQAIVAEGKKAAARAREEAMVRGASEAFAAAAAEALAAFKSRADRYGEAADDIRALAMEVARKVLGAEPDLGPRDIDKIMQRGMAQLRARRRLRLQVSPKRLSQLGGERPNLMKALQSEPDLVIEAVDDVSTGFARVVTEIGGALCAEETALDALAATVNVREQPRQQRSNTQSTATTNAGTAPSGIKAFRDDISGTGPGSSLRSSPSEGPGSSLRSSPSEGPGSGTRGEGRGPSSVSDADVEEVSPDEENDETMNLSPSSKAAQAGRAAARGAQPLSATGKIGAERPTARGTANASTSLRGEDVEEIEAEEDELLDEPTARRKGFNPNDISATGRGEEQPQQRARGHVPIAPGRTATRAVPLPPSSSDRRGATNGGHIGNGNKPNNAGNIGNGNNANNANNANNGNDDDEGDSTMRQAPLLRDSVESEGDDELDLFTDDAVRTPRKKR